MLRPIIDFFAGLWTGSASLDDCASGPAGGKHPETALPIDPDQLEELLGRVTELTGKVTQDVGDHTKSVEAISSELQSVAESNPAAVAAIVCRLLVANQELQGRLQRAEG